MIANISPSILNIEETINTLKYANRAKNIKTNLKKNIIENVNSSNFDQIIDGLKNEIEDLRHQLAVKTHNQLLNSKILNYLKKKMMLIQTQINKIKCKMILLHIFKKKLKSVKRS